MNYKLCHECNGVMYPCKVSKTYNVNGKYITVDNINAFKCVKCGEIVFDSEEVKRLEEYIENNLY